jgi:hypothetical protein
VPRRSQRVRTALSYAIYLTGRNVVYWYGNGKVKDREPLDNVRFFVGDNSFLIASILINRAIYLRLQPFLASQP